MIYVTVKQEPIYRQMSLEEFLFGSGTTPALINMNTANTRTYEVERLSERFARHFDIESLIAKLEQFNLSSEYLREKNRRELYDTFSIPKKSGGLRRIDAPNTELKEALYRLKSILENDFRALYHTSAFAYVKQRSTVDAIKRHQANNSRWFWKSDLSNFFGSTTLDFVMRQLSMVFPFSEVIRIPYGERELRKALELAFLNGGLPQGTPISPLITNVMMIPFDFRVSKKLREIDEENFVYTRYADDFIISSRHKFEPRQLEQLISDVLREFNAPFIIKPEKTRYGSSNGRNWNLGLMLNKDNQITVGHKRKRQLQSMLHNYIMDKRSGIEWPLEDVQTMDGYYNYYRNVEKDAIDAIINHIDRKMGVDVVQMIKDDIRR